MDWFNCMIATFAGTSAEKVERSNSSSALWAVQLSFGKLTLKIVFDNKELWIQMLLLDFLIMNKIMHINFTLCKGVLTTYLFQ